MKLAIHFEKEAVIIDELVTQVQQLANHSRSSQSDATSFTENWEECKKNIDFAATNLEKTNGSVDKLSERIERNRNAAEKEIRSERNAAKVEMEISRGATERLIEALREETQLAISEMRRKAEARLQRL